MLTDFDILISIVILIAIFVTVKSGFIGACFSILVYTASGLVTFYAYPHALNYTENIFKNDLLASAIALVGIFTICFIILELTRKIILGSINIVSLGGLDKVLGFFSGIIIGLIIASTIHLLIVKFVEKEPKWIKEGKTYPVTRRGSKILGKFTLDTKQKKKILKNMDEKLSESRSTIEDEWHDFFEEEKFLDLLITNKSKKSF